LTRTIAAELLDRDSAAVVSCLTPNPATKPIAITIKWRRLVGLLARRLSVDHYRSTARRVNQPEVHTEEVLGPRIKVP
jgi:hypothetical protein